MRPFRSCFSCFFSSLPRKLNMRPTQKESVFDKVPPEIWKLIFSYACHNDGGSTGRALSLVSTYVHDVSAELKFRSLAVCGLQQIIGCYDALRTTAPENRRILHLFLSPHRQVPPDQNEPVDDERYKVPVHFESGCYAFYGILEIAGPHLRSFYLDSAITRPDILLNVPMPKLTELTMLNGFRFQFPGQVPANGVNGHTQVHIFPNLKCLRFVGFTDIPRHALQVIRDCCPNVSHLFFQCNKTPCELVEMIVSMFGLQQITTRQVAPFPQEFLNNIAELRIEGVRDKNQWRGLRFNKLVGDLVAVEPRVQYTQTELQESVPFPFGFKDWLRDSTREWRFPSPHSFIED